MWILILTIAFDTGVHTHTQEMTSRETCMAAANLWLKTTRETKDRAQDRFTAVCSPK